MSRKKELNNNIEDQFRKLISEKIEAKSPKLIGDFEVPLWWECTWRRERCGRCHFCISMDRSEVEAGKDPSEIIVGDLVRMDDMIEGDEIDDDALNDEEEVELDNLMKMMEEMPKPDAFPSLRKLNCWSRELIDFLSIAKVKKDSEYFDAIWYSTLLPSKVYRQIHTKWLRQKEIVEDMDGFYEIELTYNDFVIKESARILDISISKLATRSRKMKLFYEQFIKIRPNIATLCNYKKI